MYSEIAPKETFVVCAEVAKWLRTRTKSRYEGTKMRVPEPPLLLRPVMFFTSVERIVVVKCLKRASGSLDGERLSIRVKVCFTDTGSGSSVMAPA